MAVSRVPLLPLRQGLSSAKSVQVERQKSARGAMRCLYSVRTVPFGHREFALIAKAMPIFCKNSDFF